MTTIKCRGISVGKECALSVQSEVCDSVVGNSSSVLVDLKGIHWTVNTSLRLAIKLFYLSPLVPDAPVIGVVRTYSHMTGSISAITTSLIGMVRIAHNNCVHNVS